MSNNSAVYGTQKAEDIIFSLSVVSKYHYCLAQKTSSENLISQSPVMKNDFVLIDRNVRDASISFLSCSCFAVLFKKNTVSAF